MVVAKFRPAENEIGCFVCICVGVRVHYFSRKGKQHPQQWPSSKPRQAGATGLGRAVFLGLFILPELPMLNTLPWDMVTDTPPFILNQKCTKFLKELPSMI